MIERCVIAVMLAFMVTASGTAMGKPKQPQTTPLPVLEPVAPIADIPHVSVQQDGRVVIETEGKTIVFQPSGSTVTIDEFDADMQQLSHATLTADATTLPAPIDIDWTSLSAAVGQTTCGSVSVPLATIDYDGHSNPSMSCLTAAAVLAAATVAMGAACIGPQALLGPCAAAIAAYLMALDNYYASCAHYTMQY